MTCTPALVPLLALVAGCATANFDSVVDRSQKYDVKELSVVATGPSLDLSQKLCETLAKRLDVNAIRNDFRAIPPGGARKLSLEVSTEPDAVEKALREAERPFVLLAQMTNVRIVSNGQGWSSASAVDMEYAMFSRGVGKVIWRANMRADAHTNWPGAETVLLDEIVDKLVEQLGADGLMAASKTEPTPKAPQQGGVPIE